MNLVLSACTEAQTHALGERLGQVCPSGLLIALHGPLGAGKTRLTRGIAQGAAVADSSLVRQRGDRNQFMIGVATTYRFDFTM